MKKNKFKKCPACKQRKLYYRNGLPISKYCGFCKKQKALEKKEKHKLTKDFLKQQKKKKKNLCDRLWIEAVKKAYGLQCLYPNCKSLKINIHHIIGRRNKNTRWYVPNGIPLCSKHHVFDQDSAHQNPLLFDEILLEQRGENWKSNLLTKSAQAWDKDYDRIIADLEKLKNL